MEEKILTENITFLHSRDGGFTFPRIQEYLDDGWYIKNIFYSPMSGTGSSLHGISITVHLQKSTE